MSDLIRKFVRSQMEGSDNVEDTHLNTPLPKDICIDCKRDMARYCQSCMAKYLSENTRQREIIGELLEATKGLRDMLKREGYDEEIPYYDELIARTRKAIGESK